jgi:hypothetical protein
LIGIGSPSGHVDRLALLERDDRLLPGFGLRRPPMMRRILPATVIIATFSTWTLNSASIAFLTSGLFAPSATRNVYWLRMLCSVVVFSVTIGLTIRL